MKFLCLNFVNAAKIADVSSLIIASYLNRLLTKPSLVRFFGSDFILSFKRKRNLCLVDTNEVQYQKCYSYNIALVLL